MRPLILGDGLLGSELIKQTKWDFLSRKSHNFDIKNFSDFFQIISTNNSSINKPVITFKGPQSKVFIKEYFDNLCS